MGKSKLCCSEELVVISQLEFALGLDLMDGNVVTVVTTNILPENCNWPLIGKRLCYITGTATPAP